MKRKEFYEIISIVSAELELIDNLFSKWPTQESGEAYAALCNLKKYINDILNAPPSMVNLVNRKNK